jgi:hypothetical protein
MDFEIDLILGLSFGVEYIHPFPDEDIPRALVVDFAFLRFVVHF